MTIFCEVDFSEMNHSGIKGFGEMSIRQNFHLMKCPFSETKMISGETDFGETYRNVKRREETTVR